MSITGIPELRDGYRKLGPARFWSIMAGTLIYIGVGAWLSMTARWPGICDHKGRRLFGLVKELYCSPHLLHGGVREYGLFLWLWAMPAAVIGFWTYALLGKRRSGSVTSSRISSE